MKYAGLTLMMATTVHAFVPAPATQTANTQLNLWEQPTGEGDTEMSKALPFIPRPKLLDGSLAGDAGFDPFGFGGADKAELTKQREAEIKHGRLAMLAVVGWPIAELFDKPLAEAAGLPVLLTKSGESPSLLNGGLEKVSIFYWTGTIALAGIIEIENMKMKEQKKDSYTPGDCNFDPFKFFPKEQSKQLEMQTKEIKHGRIAMMAILGFVVQEALYGIPVVQETPFFFQPLF